MDRRIKTLTKGYKGDSTAGQTVYGVTARDMLVKDMLAAGYVLTEQVGEELVFEQTEQALRIVRGKAVVDRAQEAWRIRSVTGAPCGPKPTIESVAENLANGKAAYVPPQSDSEREATRRESLTDEEKFEEDKRAWELDMSNHGPGYVSQRQYPTPPR